MLFVTIGDVGKSKATAPHIRLIAGRLAEARLWRDIGFNELDELAGQPSGFTSKFIALKKQSLDVLVAERVAKALDVPYEWLVQGRGRKEDGYRGGELEALMRQTANPDNIDRAVLLDRRFGPDIVDVVRSAAKAIGVEADQRSPEQWRHAFLLEARRQFNEAVEPPPKKRKDPPADPVVPALPALPKKVGT